MSGVSLERGDAASADAFSQLAQTFNGSTQVQNGLVSLRVDSSSFQDPRIAIATDGVGTKLKYAFISGQHKTIGIDLVAMCANDLVRNNITPLGFALYRATGEIDPEVMHDVASGVVEGCLQADCVYMTGETAEMPGFYQNGEYDLAGFAVGIFETRSLITGEKIKKSDVVFGISSSGLHSNGFSLVRKLFPPEEAVSDQKLLGQILAPTRIYVKQVLEINQQFDIHGWAHITGSGIVGKLGKIIPKGLCAVIKVNSWEVPEIFYQICGKGRLTWDEMRSTFNCGLGMIGVAEKSQVTALLKWLKEQNEEAFIIGEVANAEADSQKVIFV